MLPLTARSSGLAWAHIAFTEAYAMHNEAKFALCMMQVSLSNKIREHAQSLLCHVQLDTDNAVGEGYVLVVI